jgi:hypothetical protein
MTHQTAEIIRILRRRFRSGPIAYKLQAIGEASILQTPVIGVPARDLRAMQHFQDWAVDQCIRQMTGR